MAGKSKFCDHDWVFSSTDEEGTRYVCSKCGTLIEEENQV